MEIVIIGSGFSGTTLATQLVQKFKTINVKIIEKTKENQFCGRAYSIEAGNSLLNVSAGLMGAFEECPTDFVNWSKPYGQFENHQFVERRLYGLYLKDLAQKNSLSVINDSIWDIDPKSKIIFGKNNNYKYDMLILANGLPVNNPEISKIEVLLKEERSSINILGSGLSAIDAAIAISNHGFKGVINLISRKGLIPKEHFSYDLVHDNVEIELQNLKLLAILRLIRENKKSESFLKGLSIFLRNNAKQIWNNFSTKEKNQFFKYLRSYWEVFRHRMPKENANIIKNLMIENKLKVIKVKNFSGEINLDCTGFQAVNNDELIQNLINRKILKKVNNPFFVDVSTRFGEDDIYFIGAIKRSADFESTAVRELRIQIKELVNHLEKKLSCSSLQNSHQTP